MKLQNNDTEGDTVESHKQGILHSEVGQLLMPAILKVIKNPVHRQEAKEEKNKYLAEKSKITKEKSMKKRKQMEKRMRSKVADWGTVLIRSTVTRKNT